MGDLTRRIAAESSNIERTLADLDIALARESRDTVELVAIGAFLQSLYHGIENIIKQVILDREAKLPDSATWHRDLLEQSVELNVLSRKVADELFELLGFRHVFVHAYGFMLKEESLLPLAKKARELWRRVQQEVTGVEARTDRGFLGGR